MFFIKVKKLINKLLPGIFLIGLNIGTGSVTAMAKAGANYGFDMLWTIALSCLITYLLIHLYGKYTIVTGETALEAFKKHIHPAVGIFFLIAITVNVSGSIIGVMGIVSDVLFEWSKTWYAAGIQPIWWAAGITLFVYVLFYSGQTKSFQHSLTIIVSIMALAFIIGVFIMPPQPMDVLKGFIPKIPKSSLLSTSGGALLVTASMVGTTVASIIFIMRSTLVKEEGWTIKDLKTQNIDAKVSATFMFIISASIMALAASTLYKEGIGLNKASDMVLLLEPIAGKFAVTIFVLGIAAAGISSQFPNLIVLPWLICDYYGIERNMKRSKFRIIVFVMALLGLFVPIFKASPVFVMLISQAFAAIILPLTVLAIFYLTSSKKIMGENANSKLTNAFLILILAFAIFMSVVGIKGVLGDIF